jgi:integrase
MRKRLTDRALKALKPEAKRYEVWDLTVSGFGVRINEKGRKHFILMARYPGSDHPVRRTIGEYGHVTLAEARDQALAWKKLLRDGLDPVTEREKRRAADQRRHSHNFAAIAEQYIEHIGRKLRRAHEIEQAVRRDFVSRWGNRPISEITRDDVMQVINAALKRGAPWAAHHAYSAASALFNWAIELGFIEVSPCARIRASRVIGPKPPRQRVLDDEELRALWHAAEETDYPYGAFVKLLMLTGARRSEAAQATWREFDLDDKRRWTLSPERMKADRAHIVPMSVDAVRVLKKLPRFESAKHLFTLDGNKPINGFSKSKRRLDEVMQRHLVPRVVERWTLHDIRRSVRTRLSALGVPDTVAELVIGHTLHGLHRVYNVHSYEDEKREALERWAAKLSSIVMPCSENVIPLRGGR